MPASLSVALRLGIINEETALEELFGFGSDDGSLATRSLDLALLGEIWELLRNDQARETFRRNLSAFTGVITEDADRDGIPETIAEYYRGILRRCVFDPAQSGAPDLIVNFEAGIPQYALALLAPEGSTRAEARVQWERFPSVLDVEADGVRYIPRPLEFHFSPFLFVELWGSGLLFPYRDVLSPVLTRRALVLQSFRLERPSLEFRGGVEVVELSRGIPTRAREFVGDLMVSETEFLRGRPQLQRLDLDFDGRMDTFRRFRPPYRSMEIEDLWNYDRIFEYVISDWDGNGH